jgi:hypothetical protein
MILGIGPWIGYRWFWQDFFRDGVKIFFFGRAGVTLITNLSGKKFGFHFLFATFEIHFYRPKFDFYIFKF